MTYYRHTRSTMLAIVLVSGLVLAALASTAEPASAASPSGQAMPVGNLDGWKQIFTDDFNTPVAAGGFPGSAYSSKWDAYADGQKGTGGTYHSDVLSVSGGTLNYNLHNENGSAAIAAPLPKISGNNAYKGQTYGRYSVRFSGTKVADYYNLVFLMWPDNGIWPAGGEMDFPAGEMSGGIGYTTVYPDGSRIGSQTNVPFTGWHTATLEWVPGAVRYYLDGTLIGTSTKQVPTGSMHWVLQTGVIESKGQLPSNSTLTAGISVDWVSVWAYSPGTKASAPAAAPPKTSTKAHITLSKCSRAHQTPVSGTISVKFPAHTGKRAVRIGGLRINRYHKINTALYGNGPHKVRGGYTRVVGGVSKRIHKCAWVKVTN